MEERILVRSESIGGIDARKNCVKKWFKIWFILIPIVVIIGGIIEGGGYAEHFVSDRHRSGYCGTRHCEFELSEMMSEVGQGLAGGVLFSLVGGFLLTCIIHIIILGVYPTYAQLVVTDKRVYGNCGKKRVDLPLDMIAAVSCEKETVGVSTASGVIRFKKLDKAQKVFEAINKLMLERQEQKKEEAAITPVVAAAPTKAAELKEFKELLDGGIITQEEFDAKKKELLGL